MFENKYKEAYDAIVPSQELVEKLIGQARAGKLERKKSWFVPKAAVAAAAVVVCLVTAVPVCAAHIPAFYRIVEYLSPALADHLVPVEKSCTSQGITMQVEAINLVENEAQIIISMQDAQDSTQDLIHGEIDLFDSYGLSDYVNDSVVGGCHFLTYDAVEGKAYFQVSVQSDHAYEAGKLKFWVNSVLCDKSEETRDVDLSETVYSANTKQVKPSGSGGLISEEMLPDSMWVLPATDENPIPETNVLDGLAAANCAADDFTVTGMAYMEGVLRVQICMGDTWKSDRHVELFLRDPDGNERYSDRSVSWHEEVGETSYHFYEFWYIEDIEEISDYSMYGIFHNAGQLIEGDWNVTFRLESY